MWEHVNKIYCEYRLEGVTIKHCSQLTEIHMNPNRNLKHKRNTQLEKDIFCERTASAIEALQSKDLLIDEGGATNKFLRMMDKAFKVFEQEIIRPNDLSHEFLEKELLEYLRYIRMHNQHNFIFWQSFYKTVEGVVQILNEMIDDHWQCKDLLISRINQELTEDVIDFTNQSTYSPTAKQFGQGLAEATNKLRAG